MAGRKKTWLCAEYWASSKTLELAQSALLEAGAIGIQIDDGLSPEHPPKYPQDHIRVLAYFDQDLGLKEEITKTLALFLSNCGFVFSGLEFSEVLEEDWQGNFVRSCTTFKIEPHIFIVPSFEIDEFKENPRGDLFIEMDPENAFGTGQHQTTQLCLKNIALVLNNVLEEDRAKINALDVGTGSGILAILLKKLGAGQVTATETDEDAVHTARRNVEKNGVLVSVIEVDESFDYAKNAYDLIVANILAPTLIEMAKELVESCRKNGTIILSGILISQAEEVIKTYKKLGAELKKQDNLDHWCALIFAMSEQ